MKVINWKPISKTQFNKLVKMLPKDASYGVYHDHAMHEDIYYIKCMKSKIPIIKTEKKEYEPEIIVSTTKDCALALIALSKV